MEVQEGGLTVGFTRNHLAWRSESINTKTKEGQTSDWRSWGHVPDILLGLANTTRQFRNAVSCGRSSRFHMQNSQAVVVALDFGTSTNSRQFAQKKNGSVNRAKLEKGDIATRGRGVMSQTNQQAWSTLPNNVAWWRL